MGISYGLSVQRRKVFSSFLILVLCFSVLHVLHVLHVKVGIQFKRKKPRFFLVFNHFTDGSKKFHYVVLLPSQVEVLAISLLSFAVIKVPVLLFYGLVFVRQKVFLT